MRGGRPGRGPFLAEAPLPTGPLTTFQRVVLALVGLAVLAVASFPFLVIAAFRASETGEWRSDADKALEQRLIASAGRLMPATELFPGRSWKLACFFRLMTSRIDDGLKKRIEADSDYSFYSMSDGVWEVALIDGDRFALHFFALIGEPGGILDAEGCLDFDRLSFAVERHGRPEDWVRHSVRLVVADPPEAGVQ